MLKRPTFGWTSICIGDCNMPASYLTDVPLDCIKNMIFALENRTDFICSFDAEGWTFKIISDDYRTYIIEEKGNPELISFDVDNKELANELVGDIEKYFEEWVFWNYDSDIDSEEEINNYKTELHNQLNKLKTLL